MREVLGGGNPHAGATAQRGGLPTDNLTAVFVSGGRRILNRTTFTWQAANRVA